MDTREYLINRIVELKKEIAGVEAALKAFDSYTGDKEDNLIDNSIVFTSKINIEIPKNASWLDKIIFVIKDRNRFLHNTEIAEALYRFYPDKSNKEVKRRISAVLSSALSKNKVEGLVNYKFSNSLKDTVWGKEDWLDDDNKIKKEHMYFAKEDNLQNMKMEL